MKYRYDKEYVLHYSEIDSSAHLSLISSLKFIQNMSTEYFQRMGTDNFTVSTQNNAVWVITKTKIKFFRRPVWKDKIAIRIYSVRLSAIRFSVEICFESEDGEVFAVSKQEYCAIDIDSRRARKISTISFPSDLEVEEERFPEDYRRLKEEFEEGEFVYSTKVCSQDIDFSKHTNNVVYVRFLMNIFSCKFLEENEIDEFEIHYIREAREGEELEIYKKEVSDKEMEFLIKAEGNEITRAYITFK
ncbi:MAG: hypothetical protein IJ867_08185 [Clostridia bacterium]|nr:hypothetical protein [Clostridia bacterium]